MHLCFLPADQVRHAHLLASDVEPIMIESWLVRQRPFEYEYRSTEYEYDKDRSALMPERSLQRAAATPHRTI